MLGVLITLLFSIGAACFGHCLIRRLTPDLDPSLRVGLAGLVGLGAIGTLTLFVGLVPGALGIGGAISVWVVALVSAGVCARRGKPAIQMAKGPELLLLLGVAAALVFALVSVLAPSDIVEWDTLAYHLAVPKLWLTAGHIYPITFIHHSNFPFAVDNLYIWGLFWGGEPGAKAFTLALHVFGIMSVFGMARQIYGATAGWWAALTWTTIPAVMWLSGTAYIDVQNGLYAGLGILFAATYIQQRRNSDLWLAGIMLGLAAGSKYTGLQTIFAIGVVMGVAMLLSRKTSDLPAIGIKSIALVCGVALLIGAPWYIKNTLWTGNPVYPFFYKQFGGTNWSKWQGDIYQNEQQSFGVARPFSPDGYTSNPLEPQRIGTAILGLAYQPGRYINPGETSGEGFPIGAIGFAVIGSMLLWMISGKGTRFEGAGLGTVLLSFGMWFFLSEQSRYIIALGVPLSVLAGGAVLRLRAGAFLAAAVVVQALVSFYVVKTLRFDQQIQVVTGKVSATDYMTQTTPFYEPAQYLNQAAKGGRVALYDEVFGYLLDVPYLWANPGHSNELGYDKMQTGDDLIKALKSERVTKVYLNLSIYPQSDKTYARWIQATGLVGQVIPYSPEERAKLKADPGQWWKVVLADAISGHELEVEKSFGRRLVLAVR